MKNGLSIFRLLCRGLALGVGLGVFLPVVGSAACQYIDWGIQVVVPSGASSLQITGGDIKRDGSFYSSPNVGGNYSASGIYYSGQNCSMAPPNCVYAGHTWTQRLGVRVNGMGSYTYFDFPLTQLGGNTPNGFCGIGAIVTAEGPAAAAHCFNYQLTNVKPFPVTVRITVGTTVDGGTVQPGQTAGWKICRDGDATTATVEIMNPDGTYSNFESYGPNSSAWGEAPGGGTPAEATWGMPTNTFKAYGLTNVMDWTNQFGADTGDLAKENTLRQFASDSHVVNVEGFKAASDLLRNIVSKGHDGNTTLVNIDGKMTSVNNALADLQSKQAAANAKLANLDTMSANITPLGGKLDVANAHLSGMSGNLGNLGAMNTKLGNIETSSASGAAAVAAGNSKLDTIATKLDSELVYGNQIVGVLGEVKNKFDLELGHWNTFDGISQNQLTVLGNIKSAIDTVNQTETSQGNRANLDMAELKSMASPLSDKLSDIKAAIQAASAANSSKLADLIEIATANGVTGEEIGAAIDAGNAHLGVIKTDIHGNLPQIEVNTRSGAAAGWGTSNRVAEVGAGVGVITNQLNGILGAVTNVDTNGYSAEAAHKWATNHSPRVFDNSAAQAAANAAAAPLVSSLNGLASSFNSAASGAGDLGGGVSGAWTANIGSLSVNLNPLNHATWSSFAYWTRLVFQWTVWVLVVVLLLPVVERHVQTLALTPQATTSGESVLGSNINAVSTLAMAAVICTIIIASGVALVAILSASGVLPKVLSSPFGSASGVIASALAFADRVLPITDMVGAAFTYLGLRAAMGAIFSGSACVIKFMVGV